MDSATVGERRERPDRTGRGGISIARAERVRLQQRPRHQLPALRRPSRCRTRLAQRTRALSTTPGPPSGGRQLLWCDRRAPGVLPARHARRISVRRDVRERRPTPRIRPRRRLPRRPRSRCRHRAAGSGASRPRTGEEQRARTTPFSRFGRIRVSSAPGTRTRSAGCASRSRSGCGWTCNAKSGMPTSRSASARRGSARRRRAAAQSDWFASRLQHRRKHSDRVTRVSNPRSADATRSPCPCLDIRPRPYERLSESRNRFWEIRVAPAPTVGHAANLELHFGAPRNALNDPAGIPAVPNLSRRRIADRNTRQAGPDGRVFCQVICNPRPRSSGDRASASGAVCAGSNPAEGATVTPTENTT